jgi:heptosyltransferase-2
MKGENILVWLPSPMGDAILSTPALRAIRERFQEARIFFVGNSTVRQVLEPCPFNDEWIDSTHKDTLSLGLELRKHAFSSVVLFKNSFSSGLGAFLSGAKHRIGYARDGRSLFLTDKIAPRRDADGKIEPVTMVDYYLTIAQSMGCETTDRRTELCVDDEDVLSLSAKLPSVMGGGERVAVLVPGGSFGASKFWCADRYAEIARRLVDDLGATVVVSVAPNDMERQIAGNVCNLSDRKLVNLGDNPLTPGELKALIAEADIVICNDTGPRHIAIALGRKVVSLFGPNNPAWTQTDYADEVQIVGTAECVPCEKPKCTQAEHICMESISVDEVWAAVEKLLGKGKS